VALKVTKTEMWSLVVTIDDRAGGAAEEIEPLAGVGGRIIGHFRRLFIDP
jgi:hypothetical protein